MNPDADLSLLVEEQALALARDIAKYPDVLLQCLDNSEPVTLVTYLFALSRSINSAFVVLQVKGSEQKLAEARLLLFEAGRITLNNGIRMLGIQPLDRM